jgi:hypothetical protein
MFHDRTPFSIRSVWSDPVQLFAGGGIHRFIDDEQPHKACAKANAALSA